MKTYKKYKELAVTYWEALNNNNLTKDERQKDIQNFNKFFDNFILCVYFVFGVFSLISLYFFITRVIF